MSIWVRLSKTEFHFYMSSVTQVQGLCGTFTWKQQDDFLTPTGDIETSVTAFASKFQVSGGERCPSMDNTPQFSCSTYSQRLTFAEATCAILHGPTFQVLGRPPPLPVRSRIQTARKSQGHRAQGNGIHKERTAPFLFVQRSAMG